MRPEKVTIVEDLQAKLNASPFVLVADYSGLRVEQFSTLRNRLAEVGSECRVVKNTFLRRALSDAGLPDISADLVGQTAIVLGEKDVAAAAKVLKTFNKETKKLEVRVGVVDRAILDASQIATIADLPSRDVLLGILLGTLQAPASTLVRLLNEPATQLARVLKAKIDGEGAPAGEPAGDSEPAGEAEAAA